VSWGPTLIVNIGFDPDYKSGGAPPKPGMTGLEALVDTGASECCVDDWLATQLKLPVVDRRPVSGISGQKEVNMYLAQVHVPALQFTMYGSFAGVNLLAGGQIHKALIGRSFLQYFTMTYEGRTGSVTLSND
jgi:hypothetical protein